MSVRIPDRERQCSGADPPRGHTRRGFLERAGAGALALALAPLGSMRAGTVQGDAHARFHDLMPAFWRAYAAGAEHPARSQAEILVTEFFEPQKRVFERAGIKKIDVAAVAAWLTKVADIIPDMRALHRRFAADYAAYTGAFKRSFPDFDKAAAPTFLMPSLLHFDAHLQPSEGQLPLFFGLDGIVRFHGPGANLAVLFAHETFHCYQAQVNPGVMLPEHLPVYAGLWIEGGATWVSERLNPGASVLNILLDDKVLAAATPAQVQAAAKALRLKFDSTDDADMEPFFTAGWKGPWPARMGYLIGLHIARGVGATMPVASFVRLTLAEMRPLYVRQVEAIAATGLLAA